MQYTPLGSTGLEVSRICLGTMSFGNTEEWMVEIDKTRPIVKRALDLGVNFFDTANLYSNGRSEEIMGELLKDQTKKGSHDTISCNRRENLSRGYGLIESIYTRFIDGITQHQSKKHSLR